MGGAGSWNRRADQEDGGLAALTQDAKRDGGCKNGWRELSSHLEVVGHEHEHAGFGLGDH